MRSLERVNARARTAGVLLAAAIFLAACSSSSSSSTTTTTTTTTPATSTTLPSTAASKLAIARAYAILFDLANPSIPPKLAVVQDGAALKAAFTAAIHSALAKEAAGASVTSIKMKAGAACSAVALPSPCAAVIYDILGPNRKPVLTGSAGNAVYLASKWLVAKSTICGLLSLENGGVPPSGC